MKKQNTAKLFPSEFLDVASGVPKHRRLYYGLRDAILSGTLPSGAALPSTRTIAEDLNVARNTVVSAFDQLVAEGYIESKVGAGTFVAPNLLKTTAARRADAPGAFARRATRRHALSRRGALIAAQRVSEAPAATVIRPFRSGTPALDEFPYGLWARLTAHCIKHAPRALLCYSDPAGYRPLREAIAAYLGASRGVRCTAEQVVVVAGSQQSVDLTSRIILDPGDPVWVEDPGYRGARAALAGNGAVLVPVPLDAGGVDVMAARQRQPRPRLIYITPSCQFPTGITMTLDRRLALLSYAREADAWIFEDDYDSEFRYSGRPLAALQGLDNDGRVIYAGTFSKVLFPGLRLGYVVAPVHVIDAFVAARSAVDRNPPGIEQAVVAHFIADGHFARHVRRMRDRYAERQEALVMAAKRDLRGLLDVEPKETGMHLVGRLVRGNDDVFAARRAFAHGVDVLPVSRCFLGRATGHGLILGYTSSSPQAIRAGVRRLRDALR